MTKNNNSRKTRLIYGQYDNVIMISRLVAIFAVVVLAALFDLSVLFAIIGVATLIMGLIYHLLFLRRLIQVNEAVALFANSVPYLIVAICLVYYTGGVESPLYLLLFFAPVGVAMSYGPKTAVATVILEVATLVFLSIADPIYSIFSLPLSRLALYAIPLLMTAPFASITATRYVEINKQKEKQQKLRKKLERNIQKIRQIQRKERDMVDIMGHELRTPMSIISNYFNLLKKIERKDASPKSLKYMDLIDKNIDREIKLINTLLSATKIDDNRLELNKEPVNIIEVIKDSITAQQELAENKELFIDFQTPTQSAVPSINADRVRIQEVMDNILSNAVKYTIFGGITIWVDVGQEFVTVHVQDTGIGMSKKETKRLGRKFYRAQQYTNGSDHSEFSIVRPGGSGLGLFVTYGIVHAHGGKVWVESTIDKGSTFHFSIPIYRGKRKASKKKSTDLFKRLRLGKDLG